MDLTKNKKNKFRVFLIVLVLLDVAIYCLGHFLLTGIYEGRFLNGIIQGQSQHSLDFYLRVFDKFFLICNCLGWATIFYVKGIYGNRTAQIICCLKNDSRALVNWIKDHKNIFYIAFFFLMVFFALYFYIGTQFGKTPAFSEEDLIYGLDPKRVVGDNADFSSLHNRTLVHPLYILLINPWGAAINLIFNDVVKSGLMVNALFASFDVFLAMIIFYLLTKNTINSVIMTIFFGISMTQLCIGSFPDTMAVAVCSLLINYLLFCVCILNKRTYFAAWIPVGILTLGITITNFIQTLICFFLIILYFEKERANILYWFKTFSFYIIPVALCAAILSVIQKIIWSEAELFFLPNGYGGEMVYIKSTIFNAPIKVIGGVLRNFYMINIVGAIPEVYQMDDRVNLLLIFQTSFQFLKTGSVAVCLWLAGLLVTVRGVVKSRKNTKFYIGALLCNLFVLTLHSIYGADEMFLYTGTMTFLLCTYLLSLFDLYGSRARIYFLVIIPIVFLNNIQIISYMLNVFQ